MVDPYPLGNKGCLGEHFHVIIDKGDGVELGQHLAFGVLVGVFHADELAVGQSQKIQVGAPKIVQGLSTGGQEDDIMACGSKSADGINCARKRR